MAVKRRSERAGKAGRRPRKRGTGWTLAIHGGAGMSRSNGLDPRREQAIRDALAAVLEAGAKALANGTTALDAVEDAVCALEDSPLFNAGKGSVFNAHGEHELEASIMDGRTLEAGAVAVLRGIKNPVALARLVMERSTHVFLHGEGAIAFAQEQGVELAAPDYFWTEERWKALKHARLRSHERSTPLELSTVGAVALDRRGNLAAATSTGGTTNKLRGRVGDSSVIGAGNYASNASCAVSCTGVGEYFIRATIARDVCALVEYADVDSRSAAEAVIKKRLGAIGGHGGVLVVDRDGDVSCVFNTDVMYRGAVTHATPAKTAVHRDESV